MNDARNDSSDGAEEPPLAKNPRMITMMALTIIVVGIMAVVTHGF